MRKEWLVTTNSIDKVKLVVASDSRWSCQVDADHLVFLDDWGFHKLAIRHGSTMVCAGDAILIEQWMNWYGQPELDLGNFPPLNRYFNGQLCHIVFHIVTASGEIFDPGIGGTLDYNDEARFAGTGAPFALNCFSSNRCVKKSVGTASQIDPCTGGTMTYVELATGTNNVQPVTCGATQLNADLEQRGSIMNKHTREISTINDYLAKRPGSAQAGLGTVNASAPTGTPAFEWSDSQKHELKKAFGVVAALEAKAKND